MPFEPDEGAGLGRGVEGWALRVGLGRGVDGCTLRAGPRRGVDGSRARELLGWEPTVGFEEGLRSTIDWYLANRVEAEAFRDHG